MKEFPPMKAAVRKIFLSLVLGLSLGTSACMSIVDHFSGRKESCEIIAIGKPATATVIRLIDTGTSINNDPVVEFVLDVKPAEGEAYEARTKALVSRLDIPQVQPGRVFPARYDPNNRTRVALDVWDCDKK